MSRVVIAGGGLAGCLAALALAKRRPELELCLVEQGAGFGGHHTWSYFDTDVAAGDCWILDPIDRRRWPDHDIAFPRRRRTIDIGYNAIRSEAMDRTVKAALRPDQYRLGASIAALDASGVTLADGERIDGDVVLDARGASAMPGLELGWQKFVGRVYRFPHPHGIDRPMVMDATVKQRDGYRFVYKLPFSAEEALIEDTYYSLSSALDRAGLATGLDAIAGEAEVIDEEHGVLPIVIDGEFAAVWPKDDPIPKLGIRGGFFHPTTSYSMPDAVANAAWLAEQSDWRGAAIGGALRARADRLWRERGFFRLLNRLLFRAAEPDESYRILEHFYRLPPSTVARFYAARPILGDKLRVLSGRPPVPIHRALAVIFGPRP